MNYTLHQLQIFLKITQLKSITKASEALFLSQPAVSIQLKKFQDQFSIPLTEVVGRQLYVTDFGWEIAEAAEKILNEVELYLVQIVLEDFLDQEAVVLLPKFN